MAKRKKYRIYCETEEMQVSGWTNLDNPPNICPHNPAHTVEDSTNTIMEELALNNLEATTDPTANDDIDDGYAIGSRWLNTTSEEEFICTDNTATEAVWKKATVCDCTVSMATYLSSETVSETTNTEYTDKLVIYFTPNATDNIIVEWFAEIMAGGVCYVRAYNSTNDEELGQDRNALGEYVSFAGSKVIESVSQETCFKIQFKSSSSAKTATIRRARISVKRIG